MTDDKMRKEWIAYWKEDKNNTPFPQHLHDLRCGAKTRAGTPCKLRSLYSSGRCKFHGGLSTGARTEEGKKKVALNGFKKGWRKLSPCKIDKSRHCPGLFNDLDKVLRHGFWSIILD